jgi:hypothetical protein
VTFFERQPEKPQPVPQAADADLDLDLALSQQPRLQFLERRVGMLDDMRAKGFVMRRKLRLASHPQLSRMSLEGAQDLRAELSQRTELQRRAMHTGGQ